MTVASQLALRALRRLRRFSCFPSGRDEGAFATTEFRGNSQSRWLFILSSVLFFSAVVYFFLRVLVSSRQNEPWAELDSRLEVKAGILSRVENTGIGVGDRVIEVNGEPVTDLRAYRKALAIDHSRSTEITIQPLGPAEARRLVWSQSPRLPRIEADPDLHPLSIDAGPLEDYRLKPTDRIIEVNGMEVRSIDEMEKAFASRRGLRNIRVRSADASITPWNLVFETSEWRKSWIQIIVGGIFGLLGLATFLLKPHLRSSWGFLLFCLSVGVMSLTRGLPFPSRHAFDQQAYLLMQLVLPVASLNFMASFTPLRLMTRKIPPLLWAAAGFGVVLWILNRIVDPVGTRLGILATPLFLLWAAAQIGLLAFSLPIDLWFRLFKIPLGTVDRERAKVTRLAVILGFTPSAVFAFVIGLKILMSPEWRVVIELTPLLFPLLISYAIVRQNLLQLDDLLRETVIYGLLVGIVALAYALTAASVGPLLERVVPGKSSMISAAIVGLVVLGGIPLHTRARHALAKRFRREDLENISLAETILEASTVSLTPGAFAATVVGRLARASGAVHVALLLRHPATEQWWLAGLSTEIEPSPRRVVCQPLFEFLASKPREVFREQLIEELRYSPIRTEVLQGMNALRAAMVLPLSVGGELWGALAIGDKRSFKSYTKGEMELLRKLSRQCAIGLYGIAQRLTSPVSRSTAAARIVDLYPHWPDRIGAYKVDGLIGEGGMAYVYGAEAGGRRVAIKVANHKVQADPTLMQRFQREGQAMTRLSHECIVQMIEVGREGSEPYLVVEYLPSGSVADRLLRIGPFSEAWGKKVIVEVARGLEAALGQGVIHRDVKPRNMLMTSSGSVKIGDFGLAKIEDETSITTRGQMNGTPAYMSPEVCGGSAADWRSDQYALGISFFEMLSGGRPFRGNTIESIIYQHLYAPRPDIRSTHPEISEQTSEAIKRMMARLPEERFHSYADLIEALEMDYRDSSGELAATRRKRR